MKDQEKLQPGLYMVSTPIGNLEDLTFRAVRVLRQSAWIAAEDTRQARKLLESQGIERKELISFHEFSGGRKVEQLVSRLKDSGEAGAYISDAGTPAICDPGAELASAAAEAGVPVYPIPGANALTALLSIAGFDASEFCFSGFFPRENPERERFASRAGTIGGLHCFFESPHRIQSCLGFLAEKFPGAQMAIGREITKLHETVYRGNVKKLCQDLAAIEPRGEYALALLLPDPAEARPGLADADIQELFTALAALGAGQKILVRVGLSHGLAKNAAYEMALKTLNKK